MRARSLRQESVYRSRRRIVADFLDTHPTCQRCYQQRATEVHERLSRARGGSILDAANLMALCHTCHHWITTHPRLATADGFLRSAWGGDD